VNAASLVQLFGKPVERLVPAGIRFGDTIFAPNLTGISADSGSVVDALEPQMEQALARMCDVLAEAGASASNVARVTGYVASVQDREAVYGPWDRLFPDAQNRPAFKVLVAPLPERVRVRLDMLAVAGATRRRIDIEGVPARDPTVQIGNWMATSRVHGTDPTNRQVAADLEVETRQAVQNVATLLQLADVSPRDLSQLLVFMRDATDGQHVDEAVRQVLPNVRPEQVTMVKSFVPPTMHVMVEALAVTGGPAVREVFVRPEATPIPDAVCLGPLLFGGDFYGEGDDFEGQLRSALEQMRATLSRAGLTLSAVGQVSVYMRDLNWKPILNQVWSEWFPDGNDRPPHKYVPLDSDDDRRRLVQLQVLAVAEAQRRVLEIPGMAHGDPMSMGARLGNLVFSSRVVGTDTSTGKTPDDRRTQARMAFKNVRTLLEEAGGGLANLSQVNAFINDEAGRSATLQAWREIFAEGSSVQPKLHFLNARLPGPTVVRLEVLASC
jgi:2-iminobutanoate/2-iminopropanoate deaminase